MEALSFLILILLSLAAYSGGATTKAGKWADLKPQIIDLVLVLLIWATAVYSRIIGHFNKWLAILLWVVCAIIIGFLATSFRKLPSLKKPTSPRPEATPSHSIKRLWNSWADFSKRMGSFQSRILLSFFFFIIVSPLALMVKAFSDPLRIKPKNIESKSSHWLPKREININQDQCRRQF